MCDWCGTDFIDGDESFDVNWDIVCRSCYLEGYVREQV